MFTALIIPILAWLLSLVGTAVALSLLRKYSVMDNPGVRSNHKVPVPRGGGIAMIISALLFLAGVGISSYVFVAAALLAAISFADDLRSLPVRVRLAIQLAAVALAMQALPHLAGHFFIPQWILLALLWVWFLNLTNFMDGIDGITSMQTIWMSVGICLLSVADPALPRFLPQEASIIAAAALGFYWFNRSPARVFMGDVGSVTLGFLMGYLLLSLALNGQWQAALILPAYYLSDATFTLLRRFLRGEKVWQAHSDHAYQQAVRSGLSHTHVVCRISALNMILVALANLSVLHMIAGIATVVIAYALTACLIYRFTHALSSQ